MSNEYMLTGGGGDYDISDEEIRRRLIQDFNIECGPVTAQTRRILLKKLIKLEQERNASNNSNNSSLLQQQQQQQNDSMLINNSGHHIHHHHHHHNSSGIINGNNGDMNGSGGDAIDLDVDMNADIIHIQQQHRQPTQQSTPITTRRQSPRKVYTSTPTIRQQTNTKTDEEEEAIKSFKEVEKTLKQKTIQKSTDKSKSPIVSAPTTSHVETNIIQLNEYSSAESSDDNDDDNVVFDVKNSSTTTTSTTTNTPNPFKISGITMPRVVSNEPGVSTSTFRASSLSRAPIRRSTQLISNRGNAGSMFDYSDSESDNEYNKKDRICQMLLNHRPGLGRMKPITKPSMMSRMTTFFKNLKHKLMPQRKENNFSTSSNFISLALLIFVIIFFIVIFSIYFYSKFTYASRYSLDLNDYTFIEDKTKLLAPICSKRTPDSPAEFVQNCLEYESDRKPALNTVKEIKSYIDKKLFESYCQSTSKSDLPPIESHVFQKSELLKAIETDLTDKDVTERDAAIQHMKGVQLLQYDLTNAFKLIVLNKAWNLMVTDKFNSEITLAPNYSINLPLKCRLSLFWRSNFWAIMFTLTALLLGSISFFYYKYKKNREIQEQEQVYDLIDKSLELLQSPDEPQSMPVLHIRDTLLSPAEKKSAKFKRIWNKVVNHIENSESRVKVEFKKIDGEEFKAWKWIAATNSQYITDSESDADYLASGSSQTQKIGGVEWQGKAFAFGNEKSSKQSSNESIEHLTFQPEVNRNNKNFQALTRFLKIRNIFEKEAQYVDSNWSTKIKNTILEKTANTAENGQHDIVHIEIDDSTNEGLVFLKCGSMAGATNAFHALHGWWCEKKLVSVKFLKEERYYQRFPHAKNMNTQLETTNID